MLTSGRVLDPKQLRREYLLHATDEVMSLLGLALGHAVAEAAPHVALRFLPVEADESPALRADVDLALGAFRSLSAELTVQRLFEDAHVCVVRAGHPKVKGALSLETYLSLRHVVVAPWAHWRSEMDEALTERGLARRAVRWVPYAATAVDFVAHSDCAAVLSERLARKLAARYELQVLPTPIELPMAVISQVWHPRLNADPAHEWLRRLVAEVARTQLVATSSTRRSGKLGGAMARADRG